MVLEETGQTAAEILGGQKAILVLIAAGGDFTTDGAFASPVQLGYLYDGERVSPARAEIACSLVNIFRLEG